jgi:hypothetical protein
LLWPSKDGGWVDGKWVPEEGWIDQGNLQMRTGLNGEKEYRKAPDVSESHYDAL